MEKCQISPITSHEELIKAIGLTSGGAGIQEYETTSTPDFLAWYRVNTSFCSEEGKQIAQQVIAFLQAQDSQEEEHLYEYVDALAEALDKLEEPQYALF
jgi:hypothetical protein|nr:MAG TPA: hypothetical protein [Crassvirales sp.]